jgi:hypothetical protein
MGMFPMQAFELSGMKEISHMNREGRGQDTIVTQNPEAAL